MSQRESTFCRDTKARTSILMFVSREEYTQRRPLCCWGDHCLRSCGGRRASSRHPVACKQGGCRVSSPVSLPQCLLVNGQVQWPQWRLGNQRPAALRDKAGSCYPGSCQGQQKHRLRTRSRTDSAGGGQPRPRLTAPRKLHPGLHSGPGTRLASLSSSGKRHSGAGNF